MSGKGRRAFLQDEERRIAANIAKLPELLAAAHYLNLTRYYFL